MSTCKFMIVALFATITVPSVYAVEKPNIIVIYADDMGYGDCTANNPESKIPTPNIDRLAKEGLRFTDAHSPASTCTASRYGLPTGTNPARAGVVNGLTSLDAVINHSDLFATLADLFGVDLARTYPGSAQDSHSFLSVLKDPTKEHRRPGMAVTPGSYRLGDWKLRFARGGAASTDRTASDAVLHNLAEDPAEANDLSDANAETKKRLYQEYQAFVAARKLKPLAVQIAARKAEKKTRPPRTEAAKKSNDLKPTARGVQIPEDLSEEQRARVDRLTKEYASKITELQKKLDDVLTDEQKEARTAAHKKAFAEGKKGVRLRAAADAAAKMTDEQKKQIENLRREIVALTRERNAKLAELLKD